MTALTVVTLIVGFGVPFGIFGILLLITRKDRREAYEALERLGVR